MRLLKLVSLAFFAVAVWALPAAAAQPKNISYQGISLSPAIVNLAVDQNLPGTSFQITITNNLSQPVSLAPSSLDFKSLNETGGVAFISGNGQYGLANWLELPSQPISLKPKASQTVTIRVDNRSDLSPGGHYAAVLFKDVVSGASGKNTAVFNQAVSTLVFLKKSGGEIYQLQLQPPNFGASWLHLPRNLDLLIANTGNTQTAPRGEVVIYGPRGQEVRRAVINTDSSLVLPGSTRLFKTRLFKVDHAWLPGTYKAVITYRPADSSVATTSEYTFFYANPVDILLALAAIIGVLYFRNYRSWEEPAASPKKPAPKNQKKDRQAPKNKA
jgi:hypothetical protein